MIIIDIMRHFYINNILGKKKLIGQFSEISILFYNNSSVIYFSIHLKGNRDYLSDEEEEL